MSISAIITAAGKNSRMRKDQISRNLEVKNKLILPFNNKTVLETTIDNTLSANIDECIVVLGHYSDEIIEAISDGIYAKLDTFGTNNVNYSIRNDEKYIDLEVNGRSFTINLVEHRQKRSD